jgi:hypothetical protein
LFTPATKFLVTLDNHKQRAVCSASVYADDKSDLMNGLAAYEILELKGKLDWVDESVDIILRIVYDLAMERFNKDQIKIGR